MFLSDILCCVILSITVASTCAGAEKLEKELSERNNYRMSKRDATMFIDNFPTDIVYQKPRVIYRKVSSTSNHRYGPKKPKFGIPKQKYRPLKVSRKKKPGKNYGIKNTNPKYRKTIHKKRTLKPNYGPSKRTKSSYGPPTRTPPYSSYTSPGGFAEPPANFNIFDKPNKGESQVDSYGMPVKSNWHDFYPTPKTVTPSKHIDKQSVTDSDSKYQIWNSLKTEQDADYIKSHSIRNVVFTNPPVTSHDYEINLKSYSDIYMHREKQKQEENKDNMKAQVHLENMKFLNRPWKPRKPGLDEEIIVGGQYAEPPPRYVPKYIMKQKSDDDDDIPHRKFIDSEIPSSATNSPYVNYKNSNVAFSPQNLNDAFSIVE